MNTVVLAMLAIFVVATILFAFIFMIYYFGKSAIPYVGYGVGIFTAYSILFIGLAVMSYGMIRHRNTKESHIFTILSGAALTLVPVVAHVAGPLWDYYTDGSKTEDLIAIGIPGAGAGLLLKKYLTVLFE